MLVPFASRFLPTAAAAMLLLGLAAPAGAQDSGDALTRALINKVAPGLMPPTNITRGTSTTAPLPTAPLVAPTSPQMTSKVPQPGGPSAAAPRPGGEAPAVSAIRSAERRHGGSFGGGGRGTSASQVMAKPGTTVPPAPQAREEAKVPSKVPHRFTAAAEVSHERLLPRLPMAKSTPSFEPAKPADPRPMPLAPAIP